jgi:hypothetical protein
VSEKPEQELSEPEQESKGPEQENLDLGEEPTTPTSDSQGPPWGGVFKLSKDDLRRMMRREKPKLYRYVSLAKFIDLVEAKTLYLPKATMLPDKSEGVVLNKKARLTIRVLRRMSEEYRAKIAGEPPPPPPDETEYEQKEKAEEADEEMRRFFTFLSCWHGSKHESYAMWKVYIQSAEGVCIETTRERLAKVAQQAQEARPHAVVRMARVRYGGPVNKDDALAPFFRKSRAYSYEHEVRIAVSYVARWDATWNDESLRDAPERKEMFANGVALSVDPGDLIQRVVVHPQGGDWLKALVRRQLERAGIPTTVLADSELEGSL